jgi:hypothetical protein
MSHRNWILLGSLALGGAQIVGCSSEFRTCEERRTCPVGGAAGVAGGTSAGAGGKAMAAAGKGGSGGANAQAGEAGSTDDAGSGGTGEEAGSGGMAGDASVELELAIAKPTLATGKTYVPFTGKISASGAAQYNWSITSGALPVGLGLQGAESATVTIAGNPSEAGQFPLGLSVTDGTTTKSVDVTLVITHSALFLSDRNVAGVSELFLTEIGGASVAAPVRLNAPLPSGGGVSSYSWSPDGSKVMYLATQSSGGAAELWVSSLATPGTAQRVSAAGVAVSQIVWLATGYIAAYITSAGDAYLVDLSGAAPGMSKLAVSGPATPDSLTASPNGASLIVGTAVSASLYALSSVTWAGGTPKSVTFEPGAPINAPTYSYDGRYGVANSANGGKWWDFSSASPVAADLGFVNFSFSWSLRANAVVYAEAASFTPTVTAKLSRAVFNGGTFTSSTLVAGSSCGLTAAPWSPDGNHVLFRCNVDVRGVANVITAPTGTDFSLLPSGFLSNSFTDIPTAAWSPDSKWIALRADRDADAQYDLQLIRWSSPGIAYKPHPNTSGSGVTTWAFAPNSQLVAFVGKIAPQGNSGLYFSKLPSSGAPPTATLVSAPANAAVQNDINWLPGSRTISYRAVISGVPQLFALPVTADGTAGTPIPISGVSGSGVTSYQLAPTH